MHTDDPAEFRKGDLVKFNKYGEDLFIYLNASVAVIASDAIVMYEYDMEHAIEYLVYDILVDGKLFSQIPEEFLDRIIQDDEKDTE